jgi:hypothetical protein
MNNALTPLIYELSPANPQWYAARVTFLDKTPETGFNIEKLSTMYHHENGFRTIISNIDINFHPSHLLVLDRDNQSNRPFPKTLIDNNETLSSGPLETYLDDKLRSATGLYYPITRDGFIINKDSYNVLLETVNNELLNKKNVNSLSFNNQCGSLFQDVYYTSSPSGQDPWYGPLKNTPANANIEFVMNPSINQSFTYLFIEAIYNIINNISQKSVISYIAAKRWNSTSFNTLTSSLRSSLFFDFENDTSLVQKPIEFIIFIHFPYIKMKTRENFDVEVFGNRVLNMNPLKPEINNIKNKPRYRRFQ